MVLGDVINKLSEDGEQRGRIPCRDSKLTHLLLRGLGGNAKTSIICTIAPEQAHIEETKGTLQFVSRAKKITNWVKVNETHRVAISNVKESQENANQIEEDDDESNEGTDEERDEGTDEERDEESDGEDGEDYGDVGASDAEDEAEDYHRKLGGDCQLIHGF